MRNQIRLFNVGTRHEIIARFDRAGRVTEVYPRHTRFVRWCLGLLDKLRGNQAQAATSPGSSPQS